MTSSLYLLIFNIMILPNNLKIELCESWVSFMFSLVQGSEFARVERQDLLCPTLHTQ